MESPSGHITESLTAKRNLKIMFHPKSEAQCVEPCQCNTTTDKKSESYGNLIL